MLKKIPWPEIGTACATAAGAVGTILTPLLGSKLTGSVEAVLQAVSGIALLIPTYHVSSVVAAKAKAKLGTPAS